MKSIKTILMLMCMVPMIALTSCSKDDTTDGGNASIIGKWKCTVDNYNDNGNGFGHDSFVGSIWEFKNGGVLNMGNEMTTYTIADNNIVIAGGMYYGTVTKLTSSTLILDLTIDASHPGRPDPTEHMEFTKQ